MSPLLSSPVSLLAIPTSDQLIVRLCIPNSPTFIESVAIYSNNAQKASESSYGVFVSNFSSSVVIRRSIIVAGSASDGLPIHPPSHSPSFDRLIELSLVQRQTIASHSLSGVDGTSKSGMAESGGDGSLGAHGCEYSSFPCDDCDQPKGGDGGDSYCDNDGGRGGRPGKNDHDGENGSPGSGPNPGSGGNGCKDDKGSPSVSLFSSLSPFDSAI